MPNPLPTTEDLIIKRLDEITLHVQRMDRRDRIRMIGSTVRNCINLGILLVMILGSVYIMQHITDVIKAIGQEAARQTVEMSKSGSSDLMQQMFK